MCLIQTFRDGGSIKHPTLVLLPQFHTRQFHPLPISNKRDFNTPNPNPHSEISMLSVASFPSTNPSLSISTPNFKSRNSSSIVRCRVAAVATPKKLSPYEVLGVRRNATQSEIKIAYRSLAKLYHPDAYSASPEEDFSCRSFVEINEAYETLSDSDARAVYDSSIAESAWCRINPTRKWETDQCW